ncbi:MAG: nuclear transport factor 2 family protein [Pyrinomonadaceae bacterium]|nr:nuclear transport factor 2 family protein [Pyrinomonadaceae bacterium]
MSEKRNTEIVQEAYSKFGSGDIDGLIAHLADDVQWETPEVENSPLSGVRSGKSAVRDFFQALLTIEEMTAFEPNAFTAQGDKVVVEGTFTAKVLSTGKAYDSKWVHIFTLENEKITGFLEFFDNAAASKAFQRADAA